MMLKGAKQTTLTLKGLSEKRIKVRKPRNNNNQTNKIMKNNKKPMDEIEFKLDSTLTKGKLFIGNKQIIPFENIKIVFSVDGVKKIFDPKQSIMQ